jgi:hypothetical protein
VVAEAGHVIRALLAPSRILDPYRLEQLVMLPGGFLREDGPRFAVIRLVPQLEQNRGKVDISPTARQSASSTGTRSKRSENRRYRHASVSPAQKTAPLAGKINLGPFRSAATVPRLVGTTWLWGSRSVVCGKKNMALTVSSAAIRRSVDRSKSTIYSNGSGRLRIIWEASTTEHPRPCPPGWGTSNHERCFQIVGARKPHRLVLALRRAIRIAKAIAAGPNVHAGDVPVSLLYLRS